LALALQLLDSMTFNLLCICAMRRSDLPGAAADSTLKLGSTIALTLFSYPFAFAALLFSISLPYLSAQDTVAIQGIEPPASIVLGEVAPQSDSGGNTGDFGDFQKKVKARYQVARNGSIVISMPPSGKVGEVIVAKVVIQRAPEGSGGLVFSAGSNPDGNLALLKVDDEMAVSLLARESAAVEITGEESNQRLPIHRILPGGHTEWTWHIKLLQPGEKHFVVTSDVVYRRNFLSYDPPIIRYTTSTKSVSVQVLP
jgi:hypothetical protein